MNIKHKIATELILTIVDMLGEELADRVVNALRAEFDFGVTRDEKFELKQKIQAASKETETTPASAKPKPKRKRKIMSTGKTCLLRGNCGVYVSPTAIKKMGFTPRSMGFLSDNTIVFSPDVSQYDYPLVSSQNMFQTTYTDELSDRLGIKLNQIRMMTQYYDDKSKFLLQTI